MNGATLVAIKLHDIGHGMSEDVPERIFKPFFATEPGGQGAGLGLAVIGGHIVSAGRGIEADSAPGAGVASGIRLPVPAAQAPVLAG